MVHIPIKTIVSLSVLLERLLHPLTGPLINTSETILPTTNVWAAPAVRRSHFGTSFPYASGAEAS